MERVFIKSFSLLMMDTWRMRVDMKRFMLQEVGKLMGVEQLMRHENA